MAYQVVFSLEAEATPTTAAQYVNVIIDYCENLERFPRWFTPVLK